MKIRSPHLTVSNMFGKRTGIDLGTSNLVVFREGRGVVLVEPSVIAVDTNTNRILAIGSDAKNMLGRTSRNVAVTRPFRSSVVNDYESTLAVFQHILSRGHEGFRLFGPDVMISVPVGVTGIECRALQEAVIAAGARTVRFILQPLASALGADIDISKPGGNMLVHVGGGSCQTAVISRGEVVISRSVKVGSSRIDDAIVEHVRLSHGLLIGENSAEDVKIKIGSAMPIENPVAINIRGRDHRTGLPHTVLLDSNQLIDTTHQTVQAIISVIRTTLEETPPELLSDIVEQGITLAGGGGTLMQLDQRLSAELGISVRLADRALECAALGIGRAFEIGIPSYKPDIISI